MSSDIHSQEDKKSSTTQCYNTPSQVEAKEVEAIEATISSKDETPHVVGTIIPDI